MQVRKRSLLGVLCALAVVALMCASSLIAAQEEAEISGTVFAYEWDANNNPTAVVITTFEGEEIAVSNSAKGLQLLKLEEKNVVATGTITRDDDGRKTITITRYTVQE